MSLFGTPKRDLPKITKEEVDEMNADFLKEFTDFIEVDADRNHPLWITDWVESNGTVIVARNLHHYYNEYLKLKKMYTELSKQLSRPKLDSAYYCMNCHKFFKVTPIEDKG